MCSGRSAFLLLRCRLITIEMFIATLAHRHVFSYKEYQSPENGVTTPDFVSALTQMMDPTIALEETMCCAICCGKKPEAVPHAPQFAESSIEEVTRTATGSQRGSVYMGSI